MHRSGTSALTRGLETLGVKLGDRLIPTSPENPRGYFEDEDLTELNKEVLEALGSRWDSAALLPQARWDEEPIAALRLKAAGLLRRRFGEAPLWAFKDPRTSRLLRFWQPVFRHLGLDDRYVLVARNPLSVVRSLAERDGFVSAKSYVLWLEHNLETLRDTAGLVRVVVDYDALMREPGAQLERVSRHLGLGAAPDARALEAYAREFLAQDLRHSRYEVADAALDPAAVALVLRAWTLLEAMARRAQPGEEKAWGEETGRLQAELQASAPLWRWLDHADGLAAEARAKAAACDAQIAQLRAECVRLGDVLSSTEKALADMREAHAQSQRALGETQQAHAYTERALAATQQNAVEQGNRYAALADAHAQVHERLRELRRFSEEAAAVAEGQARRAETLEQTLGQTLAEREERIALLETERATLGARIGRSLTQLRGLLAPPDTFRGRLATLCAKVVRFAGRR